MDEINKNGFSSATEIRNAIIAVKRRVANPRYASKTESPRNHTQETNVISDKI